MKTSENKINLIREKCEWNVEIWIKRRECQFYVSPSKSMDYYILQYKKLVIPCDKSVTEGTAKQEKCNDGNEYRDRYSKP
jgi:hypothetical protein